MAVADEEVASLLSSLEGLEQEPLAVQAERLEGVRRALDEALARPADSPADSPTAGPG
jgi:hypothetical protein